ncbi:hypothetical protein M0E87_01140 [Corynebacterium sp. CCM 9185]|uniref:Uncharacterized protein n=1 Tax=Corynebacterium marambiense TaxID=2765364 RepID=A0ABS0VRM9_9CORY|nr:hypothetical protein [Corynebacterium marambiense]MBI8999439.1 hypothetical protein [Corynebacterium marambiense]MCK7662277.1 hypothetical protein [Corynebacterium marambiense]MCX7541545.1 hypothetical protein [Corynebacterium marambiense]
MDDGHNPGHPVADGTASVRISSDAVPALERFLAEIQRQQERHAAMAPAPVGDSLGTGFLDFAGELDGQFVRLHTSTAHRLESVRATVAAALAQISELTSEDEEFSSDLGRLAR